MLTRIFSALTSIALVSSLASAQHFPGPYENGDSTVVNTFRAGQVSPGLSSYTLTKVFLPTNTYKIGDAFAIFKVSTVGSSISFTDSALFFTRITSLNTLPGQTISNISLVLDPGQLYGFAAYGESLSSFSGVNQSSFDREAYICDVRAGCNALSAGSPLGLRGFDVSLQPNFSGDQTTTPEPETFFILGVGLAAVAALRVATKS